MIDNTTYGWVLASLVMFLVAVRTEELQMQDWDRTTWVFTILISVIWPIGVLLLFRDFVWPSLIKHREFRYNSTGCCATGLLLIGYGIFAIAVYNKDQPLIASGVLVVVAAANLAGITMNKSH